MTTANWSPEIRVRGAVMRQLEQDPQVDATDIAVLARSGAVTLTGYVNSYSGKLAAERAATRVRGVRAVANEIEVRPKVERVDADIAADVARALNVWTVPETIKASVHDGYVTLTGNAKWLHQGRDLETAIRHIRGVRRVLNKVILTGSGRSRPQHKSAEHVAADASGITQAGNKVVVDSSSADIDELC
jgi:osmotically-inducible protein OsmY